MEALSATSAPREYPLNTLISAALPVPTLQRGVGGGVTVGEDGLSIRAEPLHQTECLRATLLNRERGFYMLEDKLGDSGSEKQSSDFTNRGHMCNY